MRLWASILLLMALVFGGAEVWYLNGRLAAGMVLLFAFSTLVGTSMSNEDEEIMTLRGPGGISAEVKGKNIESTSLDSILGSRLLTAEL